jgi:phosphatidate cytidylyltransferase
LPDRSAWWARLPATRIGTAAVLGPLALVCIYFGGPVFDLVVAAAAAVVAWEWCRLCAADRVVLLAMIVLLIAAIAVTAAGRPAFALLVLSAGGALLYVLSRGNRWLAAGALYLGLPCVALVWMRADSEIGRALVFWVFLAAWASDTGAYVCGRLIGGPKLAPAISPKKTWSGAAGGLAAAGAVGGTAMVAFGLGPMLPAVIASAALSVCAQAGDLLESWIKRRFGVKDTSGLIPGHGGLLDRVDSMMAASSAVALFLVVNGGS